MSVFSFIRKSVQPTKETNVAVKLSKQQLEQIFTQVNADPLAGKGHLSKREILIDRILAHVQTVEVGPPPVAQPILSDDSDAKA